MYDIADIIGVVINGGTIIGTTQYGIALGFGGRVTNGARGTPRPGSPAA